MPDQPPLQPFLELLVGQPGAIGDAEGTGATMRLSNPCGVAIDASGTLYVSNNSTHTLFRITPTNVGSRLVGMPDVPGAIDGRGNTALLKAPCGLTIAPGTNFLYVADTGNHRIRRVDLTNLNVTTVAGSGPGNAADAPLGTATFNAPEGILAADANTIYVADTGNNAIRRIDLAAGQVTTIAGTAGFNSPRGLFLSSTTLYVADTGNHTIRSIDLTTNQVSTIAGTAGQSGSADGVGTAAQFNEPRGLTLINNILYVTDAKNHTIRSLNPASRQVTTHAGQAGQTGSTDGLRTAARFNMPYGMAQIGQVFYVADAGNGTVRRIALVTGQNQVLTVAGAAATIGCQDGVGSQARLNSPRGEMVIDGNNLYFSDSANHTLRSIDLGSNTVTTRAGACGQAGFTEGVGGIARFSTPFGLALRGRMLYLVDVFNNRIRQVNLDTYEVTTLAGTGGGGAIDGTCLSAEFNRPRSLALGDNNTLYVADTQNQLIRRIDLQTCTVTTLAGTAGTFGSNDGPCTSALFYNPRSLAFDASGTLYVHDISNYTVRAIAPPLSRSTCQVTTLAGQAGISGYQDGTGLGARFADVTGLLYDGQGSLYVGDMDTLRKIGIATRQVTTVLGVFGQGTIVTGPLGQARIHRPFGIAQGSDRTVYLGDRSENVILAAHGL